MQVDTGPQVMQTGQSQVEFSVSSSFLPGFSSITVQSPGVSSATQSLLSFGGTPSALQLQFAPETLLSDGSTYSAVTLGLVDGNGDPAQAPVNTVVTLSSTIPSVGQIQTSVTIPAGQTYARADFTTYGIAGSTLITAATSNYTSTNATLVLVTKAATNLGLSASPSVLIANGQEYQNLVVQLQDSSGDPEKTDTPVTVELAIQNSTLGSISPTVVIPPGSTFARVTLNVSLVAGSTNVTAFATGFTSGQTGFTNTLLPLQVSAYATVPDLKPTEGTNITVIVTSNNGPISGANVRWTATFGTFGNIVNSTNVNGTASSYFIAGTTPGAAFITINATAPGYKPTVSQTSVRIINTTATAKPHATGIAGTINEKIVFIPLWGLIVVAAVVPTTAFVFIRRRSLSGGGYGIDEEE